MSTQWLVSLAARLMLNLTAIHGLTVIPQVLKGKLRPKEFNQESRGIPSGGVSVGRRQGSMSSLVAEERGSYSGASVLHLGDSVVSVHGESYVCKLRDVSKF